MITNGAYMNYCDRNAYTYVNEFKSLTFSLKEGTDKDFVIPFTINKTHMPEEKFAKGEPQLIISLYPTRKASKHEYSKRCGAIRSISARFLGRCTHRRKHIRQGSNAENYRVQQKRRSCSYSCKVSDLCVEMLRRYRSFP